MRRARIGARSSPPSVRRCEDRAVPSSSPGELQRGKLLVATPPLTDPNFDRTVVLLLEYGDDGALGIMLNRPTDTELVDVLPDWSPLASAPGVVFAGGPVMPDSVIALGRAAPGDHRRVDSRARRPRHGRRRARSGGARGASSSRCGSSSATRAGLRMQLEGELARGRVVRRRRAGRRSLHDRPERAVARGSAPPARPRRDVRELPVRSLRELSRRFRPDQRRTYRALPEPGPERPSERNQRRGSAAHVSCAARAGARAAL